MISRLGLLLSRVFQKTAPDPFVIAIGLTVLTAVLALLFGDFEAETVGGRAVGLFDAWRDETHGLWRFLGFAMQMSLILVTGHALASTRPVRRLIDALAAVPSSTAGAAFLVSFTACFAGLINWGLGLIVGALLAREVGRSLQQRGIRAHYPLLAAAGYTALLVWHGGFSGTAPLTMSTLEGAAAVMPEATVERIRAENIAAGLPGGTGITLGQTLGSPMNLVVSGGLLIGVPLLMMLMAPTRRDEMQPITDFTAGEGDGSTSQQPGRHEAAEGRRDEETKREQEHVESSGERRDSSTLKGGGLSSLSTRNFSREQPRPRRRSGAGLGTPLPDRLDRSFIVAALLGIPLLLVVARFVQVEGAGRIGLNTVNTFMFALGLLLHGSPRAYMEAVTEAARGCSGIIIQFPLYAGIMGMMQAAGLIEQLALAFVRIGTETTIPVLSFLAAGVVNLFVPSGGGQWAIQGPVALEAGIEAGIEPSKMIMAVAYGDQLTNMLQPFWALPLLAITGVRARDIIGYTAVVMIAAGLWMALNLLIF